MAYQFISTISEYGVGGGPVPYQVFGLGGGQADSFPSPLVVASDAPCADWNPMPADLIVEGLAIRGWSGNNVENAPDDTQLRMFVGLPNVETGAGIILLTGDNKVTG